MMHTIYHLGRSFLVTNISSSFNLNDSFCRECTKGRPFTDVMHMTSSHWTISDLKQIIAQFQEAVGIWVNAPYDILNQTNRDHFQNDLETFTNSIQAVQVNF